MTLAIVALYSVLTSTVCRQANEVLFVDAEHDNEVLTFREVFLGSRALELLVAGCAGLKFRLVSDVDPNFSHSTAQSLCSWTAELRMRGRCSVLWMLACPVAVRRLIMR